MTTAAAAHPDQLVAVLDGTRPRVLTADEPIVYADDLGLTRGDGAFDATVVRTDTAGRSTVLHLDAHVRRFGASMAGLDLVGPEPAAWALLVDAALDAWVTPGEAMLKLVVTRGREEHPGDAFGYVTITQLRPALLAQRDGVDVATVSFGRPFDAFADAPWLLGGVKTIAYAVNMAAGREARRRGAHDALFVSTDGYVLEGPTSALVLDTGSRLLTTPTGATGILASITVETTFDAARAAQMSTAREPFTVDDVFAARGAWLLSSVRGVAPLRTLDARPVPNDAALTERMRLFAGF